MPWTPTPQDEALLRVELRKRNVVDAKAQDGWIALLINASGKKQALALIEHVADYATLKRLDQLGFAKIVNNSKQAIEAAIHAAPQAIAQANAAAQAQQLVNQQIESYRTSLPGQHLRHLGGEALGTVQDTNTNNQLEVVGRDYANHEGRLPVLAFGQRYMEWYARVGASRSPHKRFITSPTNVLYFCDGGTHGNMSDWYRFTAPNWVRF